MNVQLIPKRKIGWCYKYADRINAKRVIFVSRDHLDLDSLAQVAPDEWERGEVRVKQLRVGQDEEQKEVYVKFDEL